MININLLIETILFLFAILASNGFIYSLTIFNLNKKIFSHNTSVLTNSSEKDVLIPTLLIASNPINITSSESSGSQSLSIISSESNVSDAFSMSSSETLVSEWYSMGSDEKLVTEAFSMSPKDLYLSAEDVPNHIDFTTLDLTQEIMNQAPNPVSAQTNGWIEGVNFFVSRDSQTMLDRAGLEYWWDLVFDLHELPLNTPINILQQIKFEELNVLYSQDLIIYGITQTELRLIIELFPAMDLFTPTINHLILTIMSYYHL
jgi:hypothetical protein